MSSRLLALSVSFLVIIAPSGQAIELTTDPATFDRNVGPCEDFYRHVNAAWLDSTKIPDDEPMWGSRYQVRFESRDALRQLAEQAADNAIAGRARDSEALVGAFYASGMNDAAIESAGIKPLRALLRRIDELHDAADIARFLGEHPTLELAFAYYTYADVEEGKTKLAYAEQGGVGISDRSLYLGDDENAKSKRDAYVRYIAKLLALSGSDAASVDAEAANVLALETELARASFPRDVLRLPVNIHHRRTIAEAAAIAPHFDWPGFFAAHHAHVQALSLAQPDFFSAFDHQLASRPIAQWRSYLRARLVDTIAPALSTPFATAHFEFHDKILRGLGAQPPRSSRVLEMLNSRIGMAMGKLYVERHFSPSSKRAAEQVVEDLRQEFRARLHGNTWIGDETRRAALAKLDAMRVRVGYPEHWRDYHGLALRTDDYAGNVLAAFDVDAAFIAAEAGAPVDPDEWSMLPHILNAQYDPAINAISLPAAILQPPVFDPHGDLAQNYAVIGIIAGHELTHGFDDTGRTYDAAGRQRDWWTKDAAAAFESLAQRMRAQFDSYDALPGTKVNGRLTAGENIADLGGLEIAFGAMQRALKRTGEPESAARRNADAAKRFFVRYATIWRSKTRPEFAARMQQTDPHAPDKWRALGPLANSPEFARTFACKPGHGLVRREGERIRIW